jgi:dihydrofolate synthase/folylpolyglutamate synthase
MRPRSTSLTALKEQLLARTGRGATFGLERMQAAMRALGHPERELAAVHVAGTNGKGSVCAMVEAIGRAAGERTGLFTSPHLCLIEERIRLDGELIDAERFGDALSRVLPLEPALTFFELMTAAAIVAMRDAQVTLPVFEVGLGGRLDATNVLSAPRCTAITSIAHDHTQLLGDSLAAIAREKAGIVKSGVPLVLGPLDAEARDAALSIANERAAQPVWMVGAADQADLAPIVLHPPAPDGFAVTTPRGHVAGLQLSLDGDHQRDNAAVACGIAHAVGLPDDAIRAGLAAARWPGRLERVDGAGVTVLLDCAHNDHAARALLRAIETLDPERTRLVFGAMGDKSWSSMLALIGPRAHARYYAEPLLSLAGRAPVSPVELNAQLGGAICSSPADAIERALADATPDETILVAGSIFLAGAVKARLCGGPHDVAVPL